MKYKLNDGREIDLNKVYELSVVRDEGMDKKSINLSKIAFSIRLKDGQSIKVEKSYHYSDWAQAKMELDQERADILNALSKLQ